MSKTVKLPIASPLDPGMRCFVKIEGRDLAVFNVDGTHYAIDDSCPHAGGSLFAGKLEGIMCPVRTMACASIWSQAVCAPPWA
jgi:3-phenylpropionate/trans-cinnamate dioxygenase ferredoxin component